MRLLFATSQSYLPQRVGGSQRSTHELSRSGEPWLLVDRLNRIRQWFTYWLVEKGSSVAN